MNEEEKELKEVLLQLLNSIQSGDSQVYQDLTHEKLSCIEPETGGNHVDGLPFHLFLIENTNTTDPFHLELVKPTIRVYGDTGYATYTLLISKMAEGQASIKQVNETRIFHKFDDQWKMVHFHRSTIGSE